MSLPLSGWHAIEARDLQYLAGLWNEADLKAIRLDPNLIWWDITRGRHFTPPGPDESLSVLVQCRSGGSVDDLRQNGLQGIPGVSGGPKSCTTGFVRPVDLERLIRTAGRVQLGLAAVPGDVAVPLGDLSRSSVPLVGVIDDGCAFLNKFFAESAESRSEGRQSESRVRWLWVQDRLPDAPTWKPTAFGYGAELSIEGFRAAHDAIVGGREAEGYKAINYLVDSAGQLPLRSHGTHVSGLVAGQIDRLLPWCDDGNGGAANTAEVAFVQLPRATMADTSGRSLCVHLLNGVRYVLSKARSNQPVVINLSLGHHGGPHDGTDLLSAALEELVANEWKQGRPLVLVTGAGNGYESSHHGHWVDAPASGLPAHATATWHWEIPAGDRSDSFHNIWCDVALGFEITDPAGRSLLRLPPRAAAALWCDGVPVACAAHLLRPATGDGVHVYVAVAPTQVSDGRAAATPGLWTVRLSNPTNAARHFDVWVDRDDAPYVPVPALRAPSRLRNAAGARPVVAAQRTLNGLAESGHALTAAACVLADDSIARYSASGGGRANNRGRTPTLALPADENAVLEGLPGPGTSSSVIQRLGGTSVASALLTREVVDFLARFASPGKDFRKFTAALVKHLSGIGTKQPPDPRLGHGAVRSRVCRRP